MQVWQSDRHKSLLRAVASLVIVLHAIEGMSQAPVPTRPLRLLRLQTSEVLHVEWLGNDARGIEFRWRDTYRVRLPRAAMSSVGFFPHEVLECDEDFEPSTRSTDVVAHRGQGAWQTGSASWSRHWHAAIESGWLRLWWRVPQTGNATLRLTFQDQQAVNIRATTQGLMAVEWPAGVRPDVRQPIRSPREWAPLLVMWNDDECRCCLGAAIISRTRGRLGGLTTVELISGAASDETIDDLVVMRTVAPIVTSAHARHAAESDVLQLLSGDEWFGDCVSSDARQIVFRNAVGRVTVPWAEVRRLDFAGTNQRPVMPANLWPRHGWLIGSDGTHSAEETRERLRVERWGWTPSLSVDKHPWLGVLPESLSRQFQFLAGED